MKAFFKPTKAKIYFTVLLFLLLSSSVLYWFSFFALPLPSMCLPSIPDISGMPVPQPTPATFSVSQTIVDLRDPSCLGTYPYDPSAQTAIAISHTLDILFYILPILVISYLFSCAILFLVRKLRRQKKYAVKSRK
jgi:hypothetical protein